LASLSGEYCIAYSYTYGNLAAAASLQPAPYILV